MSDNTEAKTASSTKRKTWRPDACPITCLPFFMWVDHPENGMVPTYGGPFDSYTIPEPQLDPNNPRSETQYLCQRYDHDAGEWVEGWQDVGLKVVTDEYLSELQADE